MKNKVYSAAVIVPIYNAALYLEECLNSLVGQDYENYHIVLVDDCSQDNSLKIAKEYADTYPDKISLLLNEENIGQGRSRMKAIDCVDSDYVLFVDSDDYISTDYITTFMKENTDNYDLIIAGYTRDINGRLKNVTISDNPFNLVLYAVACCKMIRREFLLKNNIDFSDSRKGEDIYFNLAMFSCDPKYKFINYTGYFYRLNKASTTKRMNYETNFEEIVIEMFSQFREKYSAKETTKSKRIIQEYAYIANIVNALVVYNHGCGIKRMKQKMNRINCDICKNYPDLMKNRSLRFFRPAGISFKIRIGVGAFYWSKILHMDRLLFGLISLA